MTKILMVCLGNICRSPLAEAILKNKIGNREIEVDSAGTGDFHLGSRPDARAAATALKHGITSMNEHFARQIGVSDFERFDIIYTMDSDNYNHVMKLARNNKEEYKVELIMNLVTPGENQSVPDPYYGGEEGFENVYQMLDKATDLIIKNYDNEQ